MAGLTDRAAASAYFVEGPYGEDFSMRAGLSGCGLVLRRPALENLPRWKPRGLSCVYGDCARVVDGTFVLGSRFAPW